jgi:hypothetical protein
MLVHQWTRPDIAAQVGSTYSRFTRGRTRAYTAYFLAHPELADPNHPLKANDFEAALPETSPPEFADWLPSGNRHPQYLSANSSQVLALGLLGTAVRQGRMLSWWWDALGGHLPGPVRQPPSFSFESKAAKALLGETGGPTTIDFLVEDDAAVICCECKWVENGFGCTCPGAATGACRPGIYKCAAYWEAADDLFALPKHVHASGPCRLGFAYQAVRNAAAALKLAGDDRTAVFALIYNADNPYFAGHGQWPGWATVLQHTLDGAHPQLEFRALTWQNLMRQLPLTDAARAWASEKHGLD